MHPWVQNEVKKLLPTDHSGRQELLWKSLNRIDIISLPGRSRTSRLFGISENQIADAFIISRMTAAPIASRAKRKVAAYARVSADKEEQLNSYDAQIDYHTTYIKSRDDWEFVRVYTDEGVTGCNTRKRLGFQSMIDDALAGRINLIITKSVSRFARNTVDSLTTIRKLKENGIEVYFEKENIWSFDGKGELLLRRSRREESPLSVGYDSHRRRGFFQLWQVG